MLFYHECSWRRGGGVFGGFSGGAVATAAPLRVLLIAWLRLIAESTRGIVLMVQDLVVP